MSEPRAIDTAPPRVTVEFAGEEDPERTAAFLRQWIADALARKAARERDKEAA
jgi:hypothetical protein